MSGRKHSEETKSKISDTMVGNTNSKNQSQAIEVFDNKNNTTTNYVSMGEAARALDIRWTVIKNFFFLLIIKRSLIKEGILLSKSIEINY